MVDDLGRLLPEEVGDLARVDARALLELGTGEPRAEDHAVHGRVLQLLVHGLAEAADERLGRAVGRVPRRRLVGRDRRDVDHSPAPTPDHALEPGVREPGDGDDVEPDLGDLTGDGELVELPDGAEPGVVHQQVDRVLLGDDAGLHGGHALARGQIRGEHLDLRPVAWHRAPSRAPRAARCPGPPPRDRHRVRPAARRRHGRSRPTPPSPTRSNEPWVLLGSGGACSHRAVGLCQCADTAGSAGSGHRFRQLTLT